MKPVSAPTHRRTNGERDVSLVQLLVVAAGLALGAPEPAHAADAVTHWSARAEAYLTGGPPIQARSRTIVQIAVHDALNAIARRFRPYTRLEPIYDGGSPEAAVASATYEALLGIESLPPGWPALTTAQKNALRDEYDAYMAGLDCTGLPANCVAIGTNAGIAAAQAIRALRTNDGATVPAPTYLAPGAPGVYQPTPSPTGNPANCVAGTPAAPQFEQWADVASFSINHSAQFRPDPPAMFDLTSDAYASEYAEVKRYGRCDAEAQGLRSPEQTRIARYHPGGGAPGPQTARDIIDQNGLVYDLWQLAQLFALINIAMSDANVAHFATKYHYKFWRPVTAIRAGDTDGNSATEADPAWLSYIAVPPYPDYVCGLSANVGAAVAVMRRWFGTDAVAWTRTVNSTNPPPAVQITRSYTSLSQAADEAVDARVFGGIHFRTGCIEGLRLGEKVGRFVINTELKRLRPRDLVD